MAATAPGQEREELGPPTISLSGNSGFKHKPLEDPKTQIRLLKILPGEPHDAIVLESEVFYLDQPPAYKAISYTWGSEENPKDVRVDNELLEVRNNCHYALWQARLHFPGELVWIDSICINQGDNVEKSHQVQMMWRIYRTANMVVSCVGPHADDSQVVVEAGQEVLELLLKGLQRSPEDFDHLRWASARSESYFITLKDSLRKFLERPYWRRLWIIQEMCASGTYWSRRLQVLCGHESTEMWGLVAMISFFDVDLSDVVKTLSWGRISNEAFGFGSAYSLEHFLVHRGPVEAQYCMNFINLFYCSDPRDKLYGILALMEWPRGFEPIKSDYSKSSWEIFLEIAPILTPRQILKMLQALGLVKYTRDILSLAFPFPFRPIKPVLLTASPELLGRGQYPRRPIAISASLPVEFPLAILVKGCQLGPLPQALLQSLHTDMSGLLEREFHAVNPSFITSGLPVGIFDESELALVVDRQTCPGDLILDLGSLLLVLRRREGNSYDFIGPAMWLEGCLDRVDRTSMPGELESDKSHWEVFHATGSMNLSVEDQIVMSMAWGWYDQRWTGGSRTFLLDLITEPEGAVSLDLEPYHPKPREEKEHVSTCWVKKKYAQPCNCSNGPVPSRSKMLAKVGGQGVRSNVAPTPDSMPSHDSDNTVSFDETLGDARDLSSP